jgi:type IV fimbrial biogenesis protein FimT
LEQLQHCLGHEGGRVLRQRIAREPGFTLIEVMVAITLFSILMAVAAPTMKKWVSNGKVRATADSLQNGLRMAQAESLRRSRQVVFALTNSPDPRTKAGITAAANGNYWAIYTIPSMTDGSEDNQFVEAGPLASTTSGVTVTGPAAICFNSMGRLVANAATGINGATCLPPAGTRYLINLPSADRNLRVDVALGGQVHMCDPAKTLSATNPDGCT